MSTDYSTLPRVRCADLFGGALAAFGIREHVNEYTRAGHRYLTDGHNGLWVRGDDDDFAVFTEYFQNDSSTILRAIQNVFDVKVFSEHEPQFWGFSTHEEWHAWMRTISAEYEERFHNDVMCYVRGEAHGLSPGTIGMIKAEIAKRLVADNPELALLQNKQKLVHAMSAEYDGAHALRVHSDETLKDDDLPF